MRYYKNGGLICQGRLSKHGFIRDYSDYFDLDEMCESLKVSRSGYYRWRQATPSAR